MNTKNDSERGVGLKKVLSFLLSAVIMILPLSMGFDISATEAFAAEQDNKCGDDVTWALDTVSGVLTLTGTGETYSYTGLEKAPWQKYATYIKSIEIGEGITHIRGGAFLALNNVVSLSLPYTLEEIWADADFYALETISIPENARLRYINNEKFAMQSKWYKNIADNSSVYIGPFLFRYKGTAPQNTSVTIKDGTKAVNVNAFKGISNITDITFPNTLNYIGKDAFAGTGWFDSQPDGAVYTGSVLCSYKGIMPLSEADFVIKDGTKGVAEYAFKDNGIIGSLTIPASVEIIGSYAFKNCSNLTELNIAEGSKLRLVREYSFGDCGLVNLTLPESLEIIEKSAFAWTALESVYIPASVKKLDGAFGVNGKLKKFEVSPDNEYYSTDESGALFNKDKTILYYFPAKTDLYEYTVPESVVHIGANAFSKCQLKKLVFNDNLQSTGAPLFYQCYIEVIDLGKGLNALTDSVFHSNWCTKYLTIPKNIKTIGDMALGYQLEHLYFPSEDVVFNTSWTNTASEPATFYCYKDSTAYEYANENKSKIDVVLLNDESVGDYEEFDYAVNKFRSLAENKKEKYQYWSILAIAENIPHNISASYQSAIDAQTAIMNEHLKTMNVSWVDYSAVDKAIERANAVDRRLFTDNSLARLDEAVNSVERHCDVADKDLIDEYVRNIDNAISQLDEKAGDYSMFDKAVADAKNIDRSMYTAESLGKLDEAVLIAENAEITDDQNLINAYTEAIENAIKALEYKPADFASVDAAINSANAVERTLYTAESLERLDKAIAAVDYELKIDNQAQVKIWADAIDEAIKNLEYKPADYSAVYAAIKTANGIDRRYYSEISLIALDTAVNAVDYSIKITEQKRVDEYADAISDAIAALKYASIVLRHEPCGVIVSATTKEIKPDTVLAVEEVDSSEHEGTNFAVGGSIRSLHFYDINLVYEAVVVQPDGMVTVKIRLADGVSPEKCKVYHVTDDIVNPLVRYSSTIDGNYIVFETDHFSEFAVIEVETVIDGIEILSAPEKTVYAIGETIDLSGLRVAANFSDGTSREIDDYTVGMLSLDSVGEKNVTVYYTFGSITKTASFNISVKADLCSAEITENGKSVERVNKKLGLFALYTRASVQLACETQNAEDCTVRWSSDNSKVLVDKNGKVTCKGLFGAKSATVTAETIDADGNVVAKDTVFVVFYKLNFQLPDTVIQVFKKLF